MAPLRVTSLSCFSFFLFPFSISFSNFFFSCISFKKFRCWHWSQSLTADVSSVGGAPWRCVLTTYKGRAGIGLGHLLGREHDSTHHSGVEAPRLLKRSLPGCIVLVGGGRWLCGVACGLLSGGLSSDVETIFGNLERGSWLLLRPGLNFSQR